MADGYSAWCDANGVDHAHCPLGCEHPQPFLTLSHGLLCGRCWHVDDVLTAMVPCRPGACDDRAEEAP